MQPARCPSAGEREAEQCGPVTGAEALDNEATAPDGEDQMYDNEMCDIVPDRYGNSFRTPQK